MMRQPSSSRRGSTNASGPADAAWHLGEQRQYHQCRLGFLDRHLGAQAVHHQPLAQLCGALPLSVEQDGVALIDQDEVEQVAALRRQQGGIEVSAEGQQVDIVADQALEEGASFLAGHAQGRTVGQVCQGQVRRLPRAVAEQAYRLLSCTRGPALQGAGAGLLGSGRERGSGTGQAARDRAGS